MGEECLCVHLSFVFMCICVKHYPNFPPQKINVIKIKKKKQFKANT